MGRATNDALVGRGMGWVGGQGMDEAVMDHSIWGGCCRVMQWAVLMGGGRPRPCIRWHACGLQGLGGVTAVQCDERCCWGVSGRATDNALTGRGIWGNVAVHWAVLFGRTRGQQHSGGCCGASGGVVGGEAGVQQTRHGVGGRGEAVVRRTMQGSWAAAFGDNVAVQLAVLWGERQ